VTDGRQVGGNGRLSGDAAAVAAAETESDTRQRAADRSHPREPGKAASTMTVDYLVTDATRCRAAEINATVGRSGRLISVSDDDLRPTNLL